MSNKTPTDSLLEQDRPAEVPSDANDGLPFDFKSELFVLARLQSRKLRRVKQEERQAHRNWDV